MKVFTKDKLNVSQMMEFFCLIVENIVGKRENARSQYYLLYL